MKLIFGLGNPGKLYALTRHNIGFLSAERFAASYNISLTDEACSCRYGTGAVAGHTIIIAEPTTYMNNCGQAVSALMSYFNAVPADIVMIHDDLDIEFGSIRLKASGGSAGHRGIMSTIRHVQTNLFTRIRVGIGTPPAEIEPVDFVLQHFTAEEEKHLDALLCMVKSCCEMLLTEGIEKAMNIFHAPDKTILKPANKS